MTTIYIVGFFIALIAGIIFAAILFDDFWEDFLTMSFMTMVAAFIWPLTLTVAIVILILRGIWLFIRAEDLHRNVWEWMKKVWVKI